MITFKNFSMLLFVFLLLNQGVKGMDLAREIEIEAYLKKMNKPALKTIKIPNGELIDCIDVYKQPSLDHPLLHNHTIQMEYRFSETDMKQQNNLNEIHQAWHDYGTCPYGTIPVLRIQKSAILRAMSLESFGKKKFRGNYHPLCVGNQQIYHPLCERNTSRINLGEDDLALYVSTEHVYGAKADINSWNPKVQENDASYSQIWLSTFDFVTVIEAGVMVNSKLYDQETRVFVSWTRDGYKSSGCFNLLCQGFIQTSHEIALGAVFKPYSVYGGPQYNISFEIFKHYRRKDPNWWLTINGKAVGYWPEKLFERLSDGANMVQWGGHVECSKNKGSGSSTTQMGSGYISEQGYAKAAFFRNVHTLNKFGRERSAYLFTLVTRPMCYDVVKEHDGSFYHGGPGRSRFCP